MARIFINYRHHDSSAQAQELYRILSDRFGAEDVFIDSVLTYGSEFRKVLHEKLAASQIVLVVIGPNWVPAKDVWDARLWQPEDFVRYEIAAALEAKKLVVPILVSGAVIPAEKSLPSDLRALSRLRIWVFDGPDASGVESLMLSLKASLDTIQEPSPAKRFAGPLGAAYDIFIAGFTLAFVLSSRTALNLYFPTLINFLVYPRGFQSSLAAQTNSGSISIEDAVRFCAISAVAVTLVYHVFLPLSRPWRRFGSEVISTVLQWTPLAALAVLVSNPNGSTQMANVFSVGMYGSGVLLFSLGAFYLFFLLILMLFDRESFEIIRGGNRFRWKEMRQSRVPWIGITLAVVIVSWELRSLVEAVKSTV